MIGSFIIIIIIIIIIIYSLDFIIIFIYSLEFNYYHYLLNRVFHISVSPFSNPLFTVPNAPITIGIIVTCMFHSFFNSLARSRYLSFFSRSFSFNLCSAGTAKLTILQVLFFWGLFLGLVFWSRLGDPCVYQSHRSLYVLFSRTGAGLCIYHLFVW